MESNQRGIFSALSLDLFPDRFLLPTVYPTDHPTEHPTDHPTESGSCLKGLGGVGYKVKEIEIKM